VAAVAASNATTIGSAQTFMYTTTESTYYQKQKDAGTGTGLHHFRS